MDNNYKLSKYECIALLIVVMTNKLILNIPYNIIELTKSGSIINVLYIGLINFKIFVLNFFDVGDTMAVVNRFI